MGKTFLLSFPRSGGNWLRYCIEYVTGNPTIGYYYDENSPIMENFFDNIFNWDHVDKNKDPVILRHKLCIGEDKEWDLMNDFLILLLRNYKECIPRHFGEEFSMSVFNQTIAGKYGKNLNPVDYLVNILIYDIWNEKNRCCVYYEELIRDPFSTIEKLAENSNLTIIEEKFDDFKKNFEKHKQFSLELYRAHAGRSFTEGDPSKLIFHSKSFPRGIRVEMDNYIMERAGEEIYNKYLLRFKEK